MTKTVLVVDDEPLLREIIRECIEVSCGFQVLEAEGGHKAIEILKNQSIDCVLSDIRMPQGSGVDLAKYVFSLSGKKPVMFLMTGYSDLKWDEAQKLGVAKIFAKPFEVDDLVTEMGKILSSS